MACIAAPACLPSAACGEKSCVRARGPCRQCSSSTRRPHSLPCNAISPSARPTSPSQATTSSARLQCRARRLRWPSVKCVLPQGVTVLVEAPPATCSCIPFNHHTSFLTNNPLQSQSSQQSNTSVSRAPSWAIPTAPAHTHAELPTVEECPAAWPALRAPLATAPSRLRYRAALLGWTPLEADAADVALLAAQAAAPTTAAASCEPAAANTRPVPRAANRVVRPRRLRASATAAKRHASDLKAAAGQESKLRQRSSGVQERRPAAVKAACHRPPSSCCLKQPRRS